MDVSFRYAGTDVVRNTWKYVAEMGRHYQGRVTAYVLDDWLAPN